MLPYYDDRLSTVISGPVPERSLARIQYRQLLDLLAGAAAVSNKAYNSDEKWRFSPEQMALGLTRLHQLSTRMTAQQEQEAIDELHKPLTSPALLNYLFSKKATRDIAFSKSSLSADEWQMTRPLLSKAAREYLENQAALVADKAGNSSDTGNFDHEGAQDSAYIGHGVDSVSDTAPDNVDDILILDNLADAPADVKTDHDQHDKRDDLVDEHAYHAADDADNVDDISDTTSISAIVARIDSFTKTNDRAAFQTESTSLLPFEELDALQQSVKHVELQTDQDGVVIAATHNEFLGLNLFMAAEDTGWGCDTLTRDRFALRMAIRRAVIIVPGQRGGQKYMTAYPEFDAAGRYEGYSAVIFSDPEKPFSEKRVMREDDGLRSDYYRQLIHELRTPVGALQGFAEILQGQLFGPVSKQYREMAALIVQDSALLLSHFDHLKNFEQSLREHDAARTVNIAKFIRRLQKMAKADRPQTELVVNVGVDEQITISNQLAEALLYWFENHLTALNGRVSLTFKKHKNAARIWLAISGDKQKFHGTDQREQTEKQNFATLLGNSRLLDHGVKIENKAKKTIMDLPVAPAINEEI